MDRINDIRAVCETDAHLFTRLSQAICPEIFGMEEIKKALEEAKREEGADVERDKEEKEEIAYEALLLTMKTRLGLISQEKLEELQAQAKKRR